MQQLSQRNKSTFNILQQFCTIFNTRGNIIKKIQKLYLKFCGRKSLSKKTCISESKDTTTYAEERKKVCSFTCNLSSWFSFFWALSCASRCDGSLMVSSSTEIFATALPREDELQTEMPLGTASKSKVFKEYKYLLNT